MKTNPNIESEKSLPDVLQKWKVGAVPSPRFQEQVWQRVARASVAEPGLAEIFIARIEDLFRRPTLGVCYVAVLLVAGWGAGSMQAHRAEGHAKAQFQAMYVQSVDPYQMHRP